MVINKCRVCGIHDVVYNIDDVVLCKGEVDASDIRPSSSGWSHVFLLYQRNRLRFYSWKTCLILVAVE